MTANGTLQAEVHRLRAEKKLRPVEVAHELDINVTEVYRLSHEARRAEDPSPRQIARKEIDYARASLETAREILLSEGASALELRALYAAAECLSLQAGVLDLMKRHAPKK